MSRSFKLFIVTFCKEYIWSRSYHEGAKVVTINRPCSLFCAAQVYYNKVMWYIPRTSVVSF